MLCAVIEDFGTPLSLTACRSGVAAICELSPNFLVKCIGAPERALCATPLLIDYGSALKSFMKKRKFAHQRYSAMALKTLARRSAFPRESDHISEAETVSGHF
jgi:hypothetical protein